MTIATTQPEPMTIEQLEAFPDDGKERWLIDGQLREKDMTKRNRDHAFAEAKIAHALMNWLERRPEPRGVVMSGEAGFWLRRNPDTSVGIDVVYVSAEVWAASKDDEQTRLVAGAPVLAAEILSPSDKHEEIAEKVATYLECGVKAVWIVDPILEKVTVYQADAGARIFNVGEQIVGDPHLPGFRLAVVELFAR
jgi:Uma2 family endonuclease